MRRYHEKYGRLGLARSGALLAFCVLFVSCAAPVDDLVSLPEPLVGRWQTSDDRYRGRYFALTPTRLILGTAGGEAAHSIVAIHQGNDEMGVLYTIDYRDAQAVAHSMAFYFEAEGGGTVRMRHQPTIAWRKAGS